MKYIHSKDNKIFKKYKNLLNKKYRDQSNQFLVEGQRFVDDAIEKEMLIEIIIIEQSHEEYIEKYSEYQMLILDDKCFLEISDTIHSQGIIAVVTKQETKEVDYTQPILLLDRIQDPGNLGTIIRSSVASGISQILLPKGTVDPYNPKVVRSTAGAIFSVELFQLNNTIEFIEKLKEKDYLVVGATMDAKENFDKVEYSKKTVIIIGNEGNGISEELLKLTDYNVSIPLFGEIESLNASIAAAIILYEIGKQLNK